MVAQLATNFPDSIDNLSNPNSTDSLSGHAQQHTNANDAIEALQNKVGIDNSEDSNSLDYRIAQLESGGGQLGVELGLSGNNDLEVNGIENKTAIDSFDKTLFATVRYVLQIIKGSEITSYAIDLVIDSQDVHVQEVQVSSNTLNELATTEFEENSGIISLSVTPISGSVTARYYRTALKR